MDTTRRYPRTLAEAYPFERAYAGQHFKSRRLSWGKKGSIVLALVLYSVICYLMKG